MTEDNSKFYTFSDEFLKRVSEAGEGSEFRYRSKFDPVPSSALKDHNPYEEKQDRHTTEPYILSEEFLERVSKVGEGSEFSYRSRFDPVPSSALKENWFDLE